MYRKRYDHDIAEICLLTKKIKGSTISINNKQQSNPLVMDPKNFVILSTSSVQSSQSALPNRKRRSRNCQEGTNSSGLCSTASPNENGEMQKKSDLSCVVCCGVAHGYNFDAISCESCKAFFRRNALFNMDRLQCRRDGTCEITLETRRRCKSCRLRKCFAVGMRKEWILTEEEKVNKKRRIEENRRLRVQNTDDIVSSTDSDLHTILLNKDEKPPLKPTLSTHANDIIDNVLMAYNDSIKLDLTSYGWSYPLARKITALYQIINTRNTTALRLISFYKRLNDFDMFSETDKVNFIKTNLQFIFFFQASLKYDPIHDVYHEENTSDKPLYGADIYEAYGTEKYIRCTNLMRALHSIVQIDKRIIQVVLVIILFSKGLSTTYDSTEPSTDNCQQVFQTQSKYTEQLWIFIEKTYGSARAVYIFSTIISQCLLIQELIRDVQHDVYEKLPPCQVPPILRSIMQPT